MTTIDIRIQSVADVEQGKVLFPELTGKAFVLNLEKFGILEAATDGGKTGVVLIMRGHDGTIFFAQTTALIFEGMAAALAGAKVRFDDV